MIQRLELGLVVTSHTVRIQVKNIYEKLQASAREQVISKAC